MHLPHKGILHVGTGTFSELSWQQGRQRSCHLLAAAHGVRGVCGGRAVRPLERQADGRGRLFREATDGLLFVHRGNIDKTGAGPAFAYVSHVLVYTAVPRLVHTLF